MNKQPYRQGQFAPNLDMGRVAAGQGAVSALCSVMVGRNVEMNLQKLLVSRRELNNFYFVSHTARVQTDLCSVQIN